MKLIKLGCGTVNQIPLDWAGNLKNIENCIQEAISQDVDFLLLPELCITGYGCEDAFFMPSVLNKARESLYQIFSFIGNNAITVAVGAPVEFNGSIYNATFILGMQNIICIPKQNLCADGVHYEPRWFKPWKAGEVYDIDFGDDKISIGDQTFDIRGIKFGVEICEDAWVTNRPAISLASRGVQVIVNPSASHFSFGKNKIRQSLVEQSSRQFNAVYMYANLLGNEAGRVIYDGDTIIASQGNIVAQGERLSFKKHLLTTAVVDVDKNNVARYQSYSNNSKYDNNCKKFDYTNKQLVESKKLSPSLYNIKIDDTNVSLDIENNNHDAFTKAVALGLWDYMRKSGSHGFVVSLSGGIDSAVVACLVKFMILFAYNELGKESFLRAAKDNSRLDEDKLLDLITKSLLTCVYQSTENSSEKTYNAAKNLANKLGADFHKIDVQNIVDEYVGLSQKMIDRDLTWERDDITLQNIQARVRAPSVWMMANIKNALLLTTSNRSESAVGYATLDGDTCGGLAPIAGVSKSFLLSWIKSIWRTNYMGTMFADAVSKIIRNKPTAELKPKEQEQSDEDDLMPYVVLDEIERMMVKYKMAPSEVLQVLENNKVPKAKEYVEKFYKLFSRNQWKRERYAPSFHLDDESLDPKTFYRFPILNSGFKEELNMLQESQNKLKEIDEFLDQLPAELKEKLITTAIDNDGWVLYIEPNTLHNFLMAVAGFDLKIKFIETGRPIPLKI